MIHECDTRKGNECSGNITNFDGINLIYAGGHCHAPSCISMELYNAVGFQYLFSNVTFCLAKFCSLFQDTGKLLCRHDPVYGKSHEVCIDGNRYIIAEKLTDF